MTKSINRLALATIVVAFLAADGTKSPENEKQELAKLQTYVGPWRGVGQVRRGSTKGAWIERSDWAWDFSQKQHPALAFKSPQGKYFASGKIFVDEGEKKYRLVATTASDDSQVIYKGGLNDKEQLVLQATEKRENLPARISIRQVARGDRLVVLFERASKAAGKFTRMSEVGYTRVGSNFGKGTNFVECIITGGKGTIPVSYQGKTYYVCCSGCRDYFNENPAEAIAEYESQKKKD